MKPLLNSNDMRQTVCNNWGNFGGPLPQNG